MSSEFLNNAIDAILYFLLNPVWLLAMLAAVVLGYMRVKRERASFMIRVLPGLTELKRILSESWLHGLVVSLVLAGAGLVVEWNWILLFSAAMFVLLLTFYYKLASPVYYAAIALFGLLAIDRWAPGFALGDWFRVEEFDLFGELAVTVPIIAGLLLIVEGLLIGRFASRHASPLLTPTNRGLRGAVYKTKLLWLVPIVLVVPGEMVAEYVPYWPQFTLGAKEFSFVPVPLVIGFSQIARASYPDELFPKVGQAVAWLGAAVAFIGVAAIWMPILGWAALLTGVVCRAFISILTSVRERSKPLLLAPQSSGVVVVSVLEDSPAEKMGIAAGDVIRSVNGISVHDEKELYNAIQVNAAHCRLQVVGRDGEVRLMQQVLYRHDHFRLGLLVVR